MINIISWISVIGVGVGTMALIIVLSAFNGLENLVEHLYASFDPDIKITIKKGKTFNASTFPKEKILQIPEVAFYSETLEEIALVKYEDKQTVATVKGVENSFYEMSGLDTLLIEGNQKELTQVDNYIVLGYGIADQLALFLSNGFAKKVSVIVPKKGHQKGLMPDSEFNRKWAVPSGIFSVSPDFDTKYVLTSLPFAQQLTQHNEQVSAIELGLTKEANWDVIKTQIESVVGTEYEVKTRYELNELVFKTNKTEKWITFLILSFILVIASFNIIGSLTMLIIDKKKDVWILKTMGTTHSTIRKLFFIEGMLINLVGAFSGMLIGAFVCWLQIRFGLLRLEGGIVEFYPMALELTDFINVAGVVLVIGLIASWYPVRVLTKRHL
ncbi:MAG: ABC transporter permease [Vicingus serpentipes]|nr:ABC transporter permease [Vicingus serpentipes]